MGLRVHGVGWRGEGGPWGEVRWGSHVPRQPAGLKFMFYNAQFVFTQNKTLNKYGFHYNGMAGILCEHGHWGFPMTLYVSRTPHGGCGVGVGCGGEVCGGVGVGVLLPSTRSN